MFNRLDDPLEISTNFPISSENCANDSCSKIKGDISREKLNKEESDKDLSIQVNQIVQSSKNEAVSNCVSSERVTEDPDLSDCSLKVSGVLSKSTSNIQTGMSDNCAEWTITKDPEYKVANDSKTENCFTSLRKLTPKTGLESVNIIDESKFVDSKYNTSFSLATAPQSFSKQIGTSNFMADVKTKEGEDLLLNLLYGNQYNLNAPKGMIETLVKIAINYFLDVSILLFHILNYIHKSKKNPLLDFLSCQDPSTLLPIDENCLVTALFSMESMKKPHLEGLLKAALTTTHNLILSKKRFTVSGLAALCRFLTEIYKRQGNTVNPVVLCADLLKMRHKYASHLIASVAGVWPELFQIGSDLPGKWDTLEYFF